MLSLAMMPGRVYLSYGAEKTDGINKNSSSVQEEEIEETVAACLKNLDALESHKKTVRAMLEEAAKKKEEREKAAENKTGSKSKDKTDTKTDIKVSAKEKTKADASIENESPSLEMIGGYQLPAVLKSGLLGLIRDTENEGYHTGMVMIDIRTGKGIAYNAEQYFYSASTIKGPYMVSLAAEEPDKAKKDEKTIEAIARTSDNNLYSNLFKAHGTKNYKLWCVNAGADYKITQSQYTDYTAEDLARLWLENYAYFSSGKEYAETAGAWFENPNQSPIHKVLGRVYTTRTKAGWIGQNMKASNDAGIVYAGNSPYVIAILSDYGDRLNKLEPYVHVFEEIHADIIGEKSSLIEAEKAEKAAKERAEKAKAEKEAAEKEQKEAEEKAGKAKTEMETAEKAQKEAEEKAEKAKEEIKAAEEELKAAEEQAEKARIEKEAAEQAKKEAEEQAEQAKAEKESAEKLQKEAEELVGKLETETHE